jgi:putative transposase
MDCLTMVLENFVQIGLRTRCYPRPKLAMTLAQWTGCQRVIRNAKGSELDLLLWLRKRAILSPSWDGPDPQSEPFPLDQTFSQFKSDQTPWLSAVPSQILRNGVVRYKKGWSNHWKNPSHFSRPRRKKKADSNSVWLTRELFRFVGPGLVEIGTAAHPVGVMPFVQHRDIPEPNSLVISRTRYRHWFLSYASDCIQGPEMAPDEDRLKVLAQAPDLESKVGGIDRGVVFNAACSDGSTFCLEDEAKEQIKRLEKRRKGYQRRAARGNKGSHRRDKVLGKAARCSARIASINEDFLRKTSFQIAKEAPEVTALEDLNLKGMTKRAKAKKDEVTGKWLRNGAAQKSGLNKAMANAGLGNFKIYLEQALRKLGKMLILVHAHHSSQECSACGYTDPANRPDQETFLCQRCGHADNADLNAAKVIRKRGIALILSAGTADSAREGQARPGRPKGRGVIRRIKGEQPSAAPETRETSSSTEHPDAA